MFTYARVHREVPPVRTLRRSLLALSLLCPALLGGCPEALLAQSLPSPQRVQAVSLLGDTLRQLPLSAEVRARYTQQRDEARAAYQHTPTNVDSIIWYARRLGYLGELRESIEIYTRGIALYPDNPWLYRHRGHRYISVRDFGNAIKDLERAQQLVQGKPDIIEPDGQPNARNQPIGTLHSNIGYHLALAYYLRGDFAGAAREAQREFNAATNNDRRVSIAHWLYLSLCHTGRHAEAARLVQSMRADMPIIENQAYHRLMLLYKGELQPEAVLKTDGDGTFAVTDASAAYGVANWHLFNGRTEAGMTLLRRIVAAGQWGAFGTIAAEAQLARRP